MQTVGERQDHLLQNHIQLILFCLQIKST